VTQFLLAGQATESTRIPKVPQGSKKSSMEGKKGNRRANLPSFLENPGVLTWQKDSPTGNLRAQFK
jgi:hypothetical protein